MSYDIVLVNFRQNWTPLLFYANFYEEVIN